MEKAGQQQHQPDCGKQKCEKPSPILHLQNAVTGDHVDDRKHNDADAGYVSEAPQKLFDRIPFGGHGSEFGGQSCKQENGHSKQ